MSPSDPENPSPEEPEARDATPEGGHISFVERLHRHFGSDVDPKITLQEADGGEDEEGMRPSSGEESSSGSSTSRGLLRKLSDQVSVASRYEVKRELARGGMGTILRVWDDDLRRNLAMKVMHSHGRFDDESNVSGADEEKLGRFLEEAQITGQLDHPGVVPVHDLGIDRDGRCFFTMRLVRGRELKEVLDLAREGKENWTITRALAVILKVCEAMAFAHSKAVIHRDLKPSNVMVGRFGETYVMDWGLARVLGRPDPIEKRPRPADEGSSMSLVRTVRRDESDANPDSPLVTMDGDVVGTPAYMALEQAQGRLDELGPRSDIYSLGTILYYMLTGKSPYVEAGERVSPHTVLNRVLAEPPVPASKLSENMPSELVAICEKAMARHKEDRYASMLDVAEDIQAYLENRVVGAYEGGSIAEARKWVLRNRAFAVALAGMILIAFASAVGLAIQKSRQMSELEDEQGRTQSALTEARKNAVLAKEQMALADRRREEADHNAEIAKSNEESARLSSYKANILAADFSFRIGDVIEARRRLDECDEGMRGWEWRHLALKGSASLLTGRYGGRTAADAVAFSPDGTRSLLLSRSGGLRVIDLESREIVPPHDISLTLPINAALQPLPGVMDVSGDGAWVVLAGRDGVARMFDMVAAGDPYEFPPQGSGVVGHENTRVSAVAFSPNRRRLATGAEDGGILIWGSEPGAQMLEQRLTAHRKAVTDLAWAPDSTRLTSSSADGTVRIWDTTGGTVLRVLKGHAGTVHSVAWDAHANRLVTAGADGVVNLWDATDGTLLTSHTGEGGGILSVDVDPHTGRVVLGVEDNTVRIWDPETREITPLLGHESSILTVSFAPKGGRVLSGAQDGEMKLWDVRGDLSSTVLPSRGEALRAVAFHPEGGLVASLDTRSAILLSDAETGLPLRRLVGHYEAINSLVFSKDGSRLLSASRDKTARLWDVATGRTVQIFEGHERWLDTAALSDDGTLVATGSGDKTVRLWNPQTGELIRTFGGHSYSVADVAFSPDGRTIASGGRKIILHSIDGTEPPLVLGKRIRVRGLAFSPDGTRLVSASIDGSTRIWDLTTNELVARVDDHDGHVQAVEFMPDGSRFATASNDRKIRVRETRTGDTLLVLSGHTDDVLSLAFDTKGLRLLSGCGDGTARIWETGGRTGRRHRYLEAVQRREDVEPIVEELFTTLHLLPDVLRAIDREPTLDDDGRDVARTVAGLRAPELMTRLSETVVGRPGRSMAEYEIALAQASAAVELDPQNTHCWLVDGMAQYRVGDFARAKQTLTDLGSSVDGGIAPNFDPATEPGAEAARLLCLAMALQRLGDAREAMRVADDVYIHLGKNPGARDNPRLQPLLEEAADLLPDAALFDGAGLDDPAGAAGGPGSGRDR